MSIFKSTLKPVIAAQLKAREKVISSETRTDTFLRYTTGKNSWVRMISFVDYDSKIFDKNTGKLVNDNKYNGSDLAKKYILEGGTLYDKKNGYYNLRSGVGKLDGIYASDIDKISSDPSSNKVDRLYGLRPMPGITSVNITNKSAYGSLREATVQFMAWDKHQLEELEVLFMRTGYTVLLEWGWSQYLNHDKTGKNGLNSYPDNISIKNFDGQTLDPFTPGLTDNLIYDRIEKDVEKYNGNYDALLGYVKNFSWQLMSNGGFQCSTTLISRGEVIESLKASANPNIILGSSFVETVTPSISPQQRPILSNFEKIFLNIIGKINESEWVNNYTYGGGSTLNIQGQFNISGSSTDDQRILRDQSDAIYKDIKERLSKGVFTNIKGQWNDYEINYAGSTGVDLDKNIILQFCDGKTEGVGIEYITMDAFIAIINEFFLLKNSKDNRPVVTIVLPGNTPCLASEDSVSIDPTTCIIQNSQAKFITDQADGFSPKLYSETNVTRLNDETVYTYVAKLGEFLAPGTTNIGQIGNICVSINKIVQLYRNLSGGPDGVDVLTLLQDVLDACSFALGGINDFKLFTTRNIVQIVDPKYFEQASKDSKFKFDLIGLKSICRDVKINSRIFAEQSTMIAIGAGTSGVDTGNLGDIYASTQTYFNRGLKDRIISATYDDPNAKSTITYGSTVLSGSDVYYYNIFKNVESLTNYINYNVTGRTNPQGSWQVVVVPQENQVINAGSLLKTIHYQLNGKDVDFKALIPFELEITLDGISGFIIGQIFTIDKSILPRDYYNKNLGFIITGINHSLQNNDWVTTIKTQICLLDNDNIKDINAIDKNRLRKIIKEGKVNQAQNGYLYCALADYIISQYIFAITQGTYTVNNGLLFDLESDPKKVYDVTFQQYYLAPTVDNLDSVTPKIKAVTDYITNKEFIETYLKNWYKAASTVGAPNFPDSYEKFITPSGLGSSGTWDEVLNRVRSLLRSTNPNDESDLESVNKFDGKEGGGSLSWNKNAGEQEKDFYIKVRDAFKRAFYATFFGKVHNYLMDRGANAFPKIKTGGSGNIVKHIPFDKDGTLEFQTIKYNILTTEQGFSKDSFDGLFVLFYNYLVDNNASLGLSAYGAPAVNNVATSTLNFKVIHLEATK